jgi:hypothetical protein
VLLQIVRQSSGGRTDDNEGLRHAQTESDKFGETLRFAADGRVAKGIECQNRRLRHVRRRSGMFWSQGSSRRVGAVMLKERCPFQVASSAR